MQTEISAALLTVRAFENFFLRVIHLYIVCEFRVEQEWRVEKRSMKYCPSTLQGGEDYTVNKLYLAEREMDKLFNEDR